MQDMAPRPLREIQAELLAAAETLRKAVKELTLVTCLTELERNYPNDIDTARIQDGEICPPLAWGIHVDVGNATILLEEAIRSLEAAGCRTVREVRADWLNEKMKDVTDPAAHALFEFVLTELAFKR